jgi:hypothetical protein
MCRTHRWAPPARAPVARRMCGQHTRHQFEAKRQEIIAEQKRGGGPETGTPR